MVCFGLMQLFYDGVKEFFDSIEVIMAEKTWSNSMVVV